MGIIYYTSLHPLLKIHCGCGPVPYLIFMVGVVLYLRFMVSVVLYTKNS